MIQPGSKVYVKKWRSGNDLQKPCTVVSVDKLFRVTISVPKREEPGAFILKWFRLDELVEMHQPRPGGYWYPVSGWRY